MNTYAIRIARAVLNVTALLIAATGIMAVGGLLFPALTAHWLFVALTYTLPKAALALLVGLLALRLFVRLDKAPAVATTDGSR